MAQNNTLEITYFQEQLTSAQKMAVVLRYSFDNATPIVQLLETDVKIMPKQLEILEALAARFARLSDILLQKLFRAIDALELTDEGSLIDRINRMEKRDIVPNANEWIEQRKLRNQIAHDYVLEDLMPLYKSIFEQCKVLLNAVETIEHYTREKGWI